MHLIWHCSRYNIYCILQLQQLVGVADTVVYMQNRLEEELQHSREDNNQLITSHCETQVSSRGAVLYAITIVT